MRFFVAALCASAVGCVGDAAVGVDAGDAGIDASDAAPDAADAGACNPNAPFGAVTPVPGIAGVGLDGGASEDTFASLTSDQLQIVFASNRVSGNVNYDLFFAQRPNPNAPFGAATLLTAIDTPGDDRGAAFATDGLTLYFYSNGNGTSYDLYTSTRASTSSTTFGAPAPISGVDTPSPEFDPHPTADGSALYFAAPQSSASRIFRALASSGFGSPSAIAELDSPHGSAGPVPTADDLGLYFGKVDPSGDTIWFASRASKTAAYTNFRAVSELGTGVRPSWLSPDGCTIYLWTSGAQSYPAPRIYFATKGQ